MSRKLFNLLSLTLLSSSLLISCGSNNKEKEEKHEHTYSSLYAKVDATCEEDGHNQYYYCKECETYFNEEKEEITYEDVVIKALGHDWVHVVGEASTCATQGYKDYYDCSRCEKYAEDEKGKNQFSDLETWKVNGGKLDNVGHKISKIDGLAPTCSTDGFKVYYHCSECDEYFEDDLATTIIDDLVTWKNTNGLGKLPAGHDMVRHEETRPTGLYEGNEEYYQCKTCHNFYSDELGNTQIEENSWLLASLKTVTFDTTTKLTVNDAANYEYVATSKEGDQIAFEIPNFNAPNNTFVKVMGDKYCHIKTPLKGVKNVEISGTGEVFIFNGKAGWSWDSEYVATANLSSNPLLIEFDQNKVNNVQFYTRSGFTITGLKINVEGKEAKGITLDNDLTDSMFAYVGSRWDGLYGVNAGIQSQKTNNSNSAFRVAAQTVESGDPWTIVCLAFKTPLQIKTSKGIEFDVSLVSGYAWASIKLFNERTNGFCSMYWDGNTVTEMGFNPNSSWQTIVVKPLEEFIVTHVLFTLHPVKTAAGENWNEMIIDNMHYLEHPFAQLESNLREWSWRRVPSFVTLPESKYLGKSVAIDFKTVENGQFEITYMSDENHYVGEFNMISVTSTGVTAKYGKITPLGDNWYTLVVNESLLNHPMRSSYSSTITTIYLYRDIGPVCSFIIDYGSLRVI